MMKPAAKFSRVVIALVVGLFAVSLAACSGDSDLTESTTFTYAASTIIDVRTPEEFAAGHLEGAINYDYEGGTLEAALSSLDPSVEYVVYCQSGRRSALATALMKDAGFTSVADLGSLETAAAQTDFKIVTG
jgi:rhodanese-related sulfurtransferase